MPAFTIITVCLNIASTIRRTCESIINQTFQDFQWIVVDGASTDGTLDILKEYSSRIDILISEPDKGIYNAMNKGIRLAKGDYCIFLNGGDELYGYNVIKNIVSHKLNADIIYGDVMINNNVTTFLHSNHIQLSKKSLYKQTISHQGSIIKTSILKQYPYDENFKIAADYDFFTKTYQSKKYSFKRIELVIAIFYFDGISSTNLTVVYEENEHIRKKYYNRLERYFFDNNISEKIAFYKMAITHPRYIAGWIKRKILGNKA